MTTVERLPARRVYYLDGDLHRALQAIGVVIVVLGAVVTAAFLWILQGPDFGPLDLFVGILPAILFFPLGFAVFAALRSIRLVITPDRIDFRVLRYRVEAPWSDIVRWDIVEAGPLAGVGLVLRGSTGSGIPVWALVTGRLPLMDRAVPLSPFAIPLRGSRLEADLALIVPHLLADGRTPDPRDLLVGRART